MVDEKKEKPSKISELIDNILETLEYLETIPEWDGILLETQRCDGLFGWFVSVEEFMQIQNLMPCFPSSKDDFGDPESAYFEAFGEKPPTPRKAIIGYHLVPEDHADFPVVRFLCQDCDEIWKNQL
ncbi:MAG: hypothetical protein H2066_02545 [Candidatus Poseidoniales archaeon]|nr:hypothetical protein [Candidatus Poseidoniales archaeon]|tara:strand:- start:65 stop:442 length:378 start_codon:yes stop_codon:yes gene_type:complete